MAKLTMQGTSPPTGRMPNSSDGKRVLAASCLAISWSTDGCMVRTVRPSPVWGVRGQLTE